MTIRSIFFQNIKISYHPLSLLQKLKTSINIFINYIMYNYLIKSALIAALGGLLFGFDTAVISGTTSALEEVYGLSKFSLGLTVAVALIGTIIGALVAAKPADVYGRKNMLFIISAVYFVSAVGSAFAWDWYSFVIFRLIGGLGGWGGVRCFPALYC